MNISDETSEALIKYLLARATFDAVHGPDKAVSQAASNFLTSAAGDAQRVEG